MLQNRGEAKQRGACCSVQALITVDERGQMVLPKEIRDKAGIRGGDKLALSTVEARGAVCCLLLTRAADLVPAVQATLGPLADAITSGTATEKER